MSLPQAIQAEVKVNYDKPTQALTVTDSKDIHYSYNRAAVAQIIKLGDQSIRLSFGHSSTEPGYKVLIHALKENSGPTELEVFTYPVKLSPNATLIINLEKNGDFENITAGYVGTVEVMRTYASDYKLILVGDATMSPYEITYAGGSVEHWNAEPGSVWLQRLMKAYPKFVWINPQPQPRWRHTQSVELIRDMLEGRMYPLTLAGLDDAIDALS